MGLIQFHDRTLLEDMFFSGVQRNLGNQQSRGESPQRRGESPQRRGESPQRHHLYEPGSINSLVLGDKLIQPLMTGILIMGPYKPLRNRVDEFIPYYMEIIVVDRPDRTYHDGIVGHHVQPKHHCYAFVKCRCRQTTPT